MRIVVAAFALLIFNEGIDSGSAVCNSSLTCDFESTYCQFDNGSHGPETDTWLRDQKWEMLDGHEGTFVYAHKDSHEHSERTTLDLTSPPVCSGGPIQVSFKYNVNKVNSQLQVLTRCGGKDTTDVHTFKEYHSHPTWKKGNVTLQPCPHGDAEVVFRGSISPAHDMIGVDTISIATSE
ncbi:hypothetical protein V1264_002259 [Littorina saxatilis]|uniref:MAM domain-containing protein n=1 Tax=Littorina saxatilis TaxID=31220 RepID=A0AAN9C4P1_9CAEN